MNRKLVNCLEDDVQRFDEKYGDSIEIIESLHLTASEFLQMPLDRTGAANDLVYVLSVACVREFNELLLLARHRYGIGALKILRPLYERVITLKYISQNPGEAQRFIEYSKVHWHKLLLEARVAANDQNVLPQETMDRIEREYEEVKPTFEQTTCRCGRKGIVSWTKLSTPDMARELGGDLRLLYFNAFLWPTFNIHTTFYGISRQLKAIDGNRLAFNTEEAEDDAVHLALNLAITNLTYHESWGILDSWQPLKLSSKQFFILRILQSAKRSWSNCAGQMAK